MHILYQWVHDLLTQWDILKTATDVWASVIVLVLLAIVAGIIGYAAQITVVFVVARLSKKSTRNWAEIFARRKIIKRMTGVIPALFLYITMPQAFPGGTQEGADILDWLRRLCIIYIIIVLVRFAYGVFDLIDSIIQGRKATSNRALFKGICQALQLLALFIGIIYIVSVLIGRSPNVLLTGLGASAAILMLIFKDLILGLVAGVRLSSEDTLRVGDWITVPKYGADGDVIAVSLGSVKVRNFDNTIVTLPPYALVSESFQNWRGMSESGGRRIKRAIYIDMNSVKFCSPQMLEKYHKIGILSQYIGTTEKALQSYNTEHHIDNAILVNGRRQTNLGVFRAYLEAYLKNNPNIHKELTCMVRQLQPTEMGIPLELYCFTADTRWVQYENIQSDIFDHIIASVPEFDLAVFQNIAGSDLRHFQPRPAATSVTDKAPASE